MQRGEFVKGPSMVKSISWKEGSVFVIKVSEHLFSLTQMRENHLLQFFALTSEEYDFPDIDLSAERELFTIFVAENRIKDIFVRKIDNGKVKINRRPTERLMLSAVFGVGGVCGARLVELTDEFSSVGARVVQDNLTLENDLAQIYSHDLVGMVGDPAKLARRLRLYFESGVNWDESKKFVFNSIEPPPKNHSCNPPLRRI
jgi:hypothetical protein